MSKTLKITFVAVILATVVLLAVNPFGWNMPWGNTETAISSTDSAEKARADKAEAELKKMKDQKAADEKKIAEAIESIERMKKMVEDMNQPADQIATPIAPAPADSTTVVPPIAKKKSGAGG